MRCVCKDRYAVGEFLICVAQCALPCLIIKNIIVNAGLPTAYGIDQNIKIAFVLLLVPTVACWYAFLGSGLRGEQSYSPTRPMVFRRGTPSVVKELLSGLGFALTQSALLWLVIRPMLAVNGASAFMLEDGRPLLAYGIGTVCCVVAFAISCCVAPCTFGTFRHVPRGGYAIDQATNAVKVSHEPSGFRYCQRIGNSTNAVRRLPSLGNWLAMPLTNCQPWMKSFFC